MLLRLLVPRLSGHSGQDTQTYKSAGRNRRGARARSARAAARAAGAGDDQRRGVAHARNARARGCRSARSAASSDVPMPDAATRRRATRSARRTQTARSTCSSRAGCCSEGIEPRDGYADRARRRAAHQHAHGDPPHAGARAGGESARRRVRRRRRPQGRRARGDAGTAGKVRRGARVRHQPVGGGHHRPRRRHGARRA